MKLLDFSWVFGMQNIIALITTSAILSLLCLNVYMNSILHYTHQFTGVLFFKWL